MLPARDALGSVDHGLEGDRNRGPFRAGGPENGSHGGETPAGHWAICFQERPVIWRDGGEPCSDVWMVVREDVNGVGMNARDGSVVRGSYVT